MFADQGAVPDRLLRILLISDSPDDRPQLVQGLCQHAADLRILQVRTEKHLALALARAEFDLAFAESRLPWLDSVSVVGAIKSRMPGCPVLMIADADDEAIALAAIQAGLDGYVVRSSGRMVCLPMAVGLACARASERQAMREAEARYHSLFDGVPVGLYRTTPSGQIVDANLALVQMLGYPGREMLLAVNAVDLYVNPEDRARWQALLARGETVRSFEAQFYRRDGTTIWVENNTHAVRNQRGRELYYEGILEDITERKRAERALRESEESFRMIIEQSPISIQVMTPDGWTVQVNRAWEQLWGVTAADVRSYNMLHDEQARSLGMMPYVERGFAGQVVVVPPVAYHTPETLKTGRKRWFQARIYPVKSERGEIRSVTMMYEDITERQWATEDLQNLSAELMNAQEAERKRISQELHDELGQALTAMRINLAALEKEQALDLVPASRERLAETAALADQMLEHVRELSHDLRPMMLDELGLVPTIRWYANRFAKRLGIEVELETLGLERRLAAEIETILYRIVQEAFTNIARHAQARRVHLRLMCDESRVTAMVEDDGIGFDVRQRTAVDIPGQGTGLVGMRERVALWGGTLTVQSRPGRGTRLLIGLPLAPPSVEGG